VQWTARKWLATQQVPQSRAAVCLGNLACHARLIALVLSLLTGYNISAQFYLKPDTFFETIQDINALPEWMKWQELTCFNSKDMMGKPPKKTPLGGALQGAQKGVQWEPTGHTPMDTGSQTQAASVSSLQWTGSWPSGRSPSAHPSNKGATTQHHHLIWKNGQTIFIEMPMQCWTTWIQCWRTVRSKRKPKT
jgi:hypothetical protein